MTFWFFRQWTTWSCNSRTIHLITYPSPHQQLTTKSTPPLPHQPFKPSSTHSHPLPTTQPFTTKSTPPFPHRSFKPSSTYSPFLARGIKGGNLSLLFLSFPSSRAEHNNTQAVCLCPATELLSSAEGLCVSNKFLLPVYLHANLCVITVHDTGNRRVNRCPSLCLSRTSRNPHPLQEINGLTFHPHQENLATTSSG